MSSCPEGDLDLVRLAVAALANEEHTTLDQVIDALVAARVAAEHAIELVGFVPLAFGRLAMAEDGAVVSDHFVAGDARSARTLRLRIDEQRFFRAGSVVARECSDAHYDSVLQWSDELRVARSIERPEGDGPPPRLADPAIYLPHLVPSRLERARRWIAPLPLVPEDPFGARSLFAGFLGAHGQGGAWKDGAYVTAHGDAWTVKVLPRKLWSGTCYVQVDYILRSPRLTGARRIIESFAAEGETPAVAALEAQKRFNFGSLHVLLEAVVGRGCCANQVEWKSWGGTHGAWRVCLGPRLVRHFGDGTPFESDELLEALERLVTSTPLERSMHAIRIYRTVDSAPTASEGLLDGEPWPELRELVASWEPPPDTKAISLRYFLVLLPDEIATESHVVSV